jgi:maltose alpha-D-glucosyltransferase/alpha-amylase
VLERWTEAWVAWVSAAFLSGYFKTVQGTTLLPVNEPDIQLLLEFYLFEKCIYEIGYELNNRPDWVELPLRGMERLMGSKT